MIITTSRKPSSKIRTFCKHLGRFTGWEYITRGKTSREELSDEPFLLVGEFKGNPGNFTFFINGAPVLSIYATVTMDNDMHPGEEPVVHGDSPLAHAFRKVTGFKDLKDSRRVIRINDSIEFIDKGIPYIVLEVMSSRGEGIA